MKIIKITLPIISLALLSACSSGFYTPTAAETSEAARSVEALNAAPSRGVSAVRSVPSNTVVNQPVAVVSDRISSQDMLDVNVFKVPDLSAQNLTVESSGNISLPLIGSVRVAGLSLTQAEQQITQHLTKYMQAPQVSIVRTNKAVEKRVTVEGEVKTPGVFPIKGNLSFLQAIAMAQGLTEVGDSRDVLFYRDGQQHRVNLDLVRTGRISDPVLHGDDRIVILKHAGKAREKKVIDYLPAITSPFAILRGF